MAKLTDIGLDPQLAENGVWIPWVLDVEFKIARFSNSRFKKMYRNKMKPLERRMREVPEEVQEKIIRECIAYTVLLDWKNIEDDDGTPIEYSPEKALEMFKDPALEEMYSFVIETARQADAFRAEHEEELQGN